MGLISTVFHFCLRLSLDVVGRGYCCMATVMIDSTVFLREAYNNNAIIWSGRFWARHQG